MAQRSYRIATALVAWAMAGTAVARADNAFAYKVTISSSNDDLTDQMQSLSRLVQAEDKPPPGLAGLEERADGDKKTFRELLRSEGFYDGAVDIAIDDSKSPMRVTVKVTAGKRYTLGTCKIEYTQPAPARAPQSCPDIGLKPDQGARAEPIIKATATLLTKLQAHGRPAAKLVKRVAVVNHLTKKMRLVFRVDPGKQAQFGKVLVSGAKRTSHNYLARIVPWKTGATYDVRLLDKYRQQLANLNLFDSLIVKPQLAQQTASGAVPISVDAHERPRHSVGLGVKYATDTGPAGRASWEDRNLWGRAEDLTLTAEIGTITRSLEASLTFPHEPNTGQTIGLDAKTENDTTDAYTKNGLTALAQITTPLGGHWTGKGGIAFEAANIKQSGVSNFSIIGSLPVGVTYDSTKSLLNPENGERLALQAQPAFGTSGGARAFLILESNASAYRPLDAAKKLIAAARIRLGTILFAPEFGVPADMRFYAGGGGSVRGYAYQHVGPRDAQNNPIGGRAVAETSFELRYHAWQNIGVVGFVDAGLVSTNPYFANAGTPRIGAGLGLRYYTSFGPLRLDAGVPVNPQRGDAPVQIYISLGQAF